MIGYGFAGGAAAIAAADAGAKVLLLEKAPEGQEGGNSRYAAQQAIWIDASKASDEEVLEYFRAMRGLSGNPSDEVYKAYIAEAKKQVEYLKFLGAENPPTSYYAEYPEYPGAEALGLTLVKKPGGDGRLYGSFRKMSRRARPKARSTSGSTPPARSFFRIRRQASCTAWLLKWKALSAISAPETRRARNRRLETTSTCSATSPACSARIRKALASIPATAF